MKFVLKTKCDIKTDNEHLLKDIKKYASKIDAIFFETSAKNNINIDALYESICYNVEKLKLQDDEAQIRIIELRIKINIIVVIVGVKIIHNKIDLFFKIIYLFFNLLSEKFFQFKFIIDCKSIKFALLYILSKIYIILSV